MMSFVGSSGCRIRMLVKTSNEGSLEVFAWKSNFLIYFRFGKKNPRFLGGEIWLLFEYPFVVVLIPNSFVAIYATVAPPFSITARFVVNLLGS